MKQLRNNNNSNNNSISGALTMRSYERTMRLAVVFFGVLIASLSGINGAADVLYAKDVSALTQIRAQSTQYTVRVGDTLLLPCVIENRRQATVIWQYSKSKIPETLTVGIFYYRKDYRIRVIHNMTSEREQAWNLEIRKVKLEDEGYYLCKVMAEPESLKRVIHLRVEVDLRLTPVNPSVAYDDTLTLTCNTSYVMSEAARSKQLAHSSAANHGGGGGSGGGGGGSSSAASYPRLSWHKDGEHLLLNEHYHNHFNNTTVNYKIEYHSKPTLWSRIRIHGLKPSNVGTYTCKFRNQNVSTIINPQFALNNRLLDQASVAHRITVGVTALVCGAISALVRRI